MRFPSIAWNLAGLGAPLIAALLCIPPLLASLGKESFGLLSMVWALTALSGLFDLGIGRAITRTLAESIGAAKTSDIEPTVLSAVRVTAASGALGALLVLSIGLLDLQSALHLESTTTAQSRGTLLLLALCVPVQALNATYRGACEGLQQFRGISAVRMTMGCANFVAPWLVAQASTDIRWLTGSLLVTRVGALLAFRALAHHHIPPRPPQFSAGTPGASRALLAAGGWLSLSAIVSPMLVQLDRFAIASVISTAAVTAYAIPFDLVTQLLVLVSAVTTVAFPAIASARQVDASQAYELFHVWLLRVALGMGIVTLVAAALTPQVLQRWIGQSLPPESIAIGRWLCLGVWINAIGAMYYSLMHAHGRFRQTAFLHLAELPFYIALLYSLLQARGVTGAALAWVTRVAFDTLGLFLLSRRLRSGPP